MSKKESEKVETAGKAEPSESAASAQSAAPAAAAPAPDYYDQLLRLKAEFENFRRRTDREKPELVRFGRGEVLAKLLPLYDVLSQAHEEVQRAGDAESMKPLARGMEMIFKEFEKLFASEGLTPIEAQGKPYDHSLHDVMGTVDRADIAEGTVLEVLQPGFMLDGKVLRHAKVRVSRKPAPAGEVKDDVLPPA